MARKKIKWFKYGSVFMAIVNYNNKSRRGKYIRVKSKDGSIGTYKYKKSIDLNEYYRAKLGGLMNKKRSCMVIVTYYYS